VKGFEDLEIGRFDDERCKWLKDTELSGRVRSDPETSSG
jgi:hypothetical protein